MARYLGRSAEKRFSTLCSDVGVTCNEPDEDDHGWDHIVEFQHQPVAGVSADMQRTLPAVFVQTKSHEADGLKVTMRLSNALKLARSPSPCFVVLMNMAADNTTPSWHAVHFWETLIGRVLKRAREASRDGVPEDDFNDLSFNFTMTDADLFAQENLLPWIEQTIRAIGPDYAAAKKVLPAKDQVVGTLQVGPLSSIEDLIDHQLGLTPTIPITSVTMSSRRFGVDLPLPIPDWPVAYGSMQARPSGPCEIRMYGPDKVEMTVAGEIIVPSIPNLADEHLKVRVRAKMLDLVWSPVGDGGAQITGKIAPKEKLTPTELEQMVRLASWCGQGAIDVRVTARDTRLLGAAAQLSALPEQETFAILVEQLAPLVRLSEHLKIKVPRISLADALESEALPQLYSFLAATETTAKTALKTGQMIPDVTAAIAVGIAGVGDWVFAAIQRLPIVDQQRDNESWTINFGAPVLLESYAFEVSDADTLEQLQADYKRLATAPGMLSLDNVMPILNLSPAIG